MGSEENICMTQWCSVNFTCCLTVFCCPYQNYYKEIVASEHLENQLQQMLLHYLENVVLLAGMNTTPEISKLGQILFVCLYQLNK